jgi:hypothetical protein
MTDKQLALYRYLTLWADFTPAEAMSAISPQKSDVIHSREALRVAASERIYCSMEQDMNGRAA